MQPLLLLLSWILVTRQSQLALSWYPLPALLPENFAVPVSVHLFAEPGDQTPARGRLEVGGAFAIQTNLILM